jgi:hypothetical protein
MADMTRLFSSVAPTSCCSAVSAPSPYGKYDKTNYTIVHGYNIVILRGMS